MSSSSPYFSSYRHKASSVRSLCWQGDTLVDWVVGGRRWSSDGEFQPSVRYAYRFDAAVISPDGQYAVIYERLGTKGLVLHRGKVLREINRSFYQANAYEYPICLFEVAGTALLAHCPLEYNVLQLEEALTGKSLTAEPSRTPQDFFHSRLAASPGGKYLLSAGWVWQPWDEVLYFDVEKALRDPHHLDDLSSTTLPQAFNLGVAEHSSACWVSDDLLAIGANDGSEDPEEIKDLGGAPIVRPRGIALYQVSTQKVLTSVQLEQPPGTLMAVGSHHVIAFYQHPRLISLENGRVLHEWSDLHSGTQISSILLSFKEPLPPLALDPQHQRFAIAQDGEIHVITLQVE